MFQSQIAFPVTLNLTGDLADDRHPVWRAPYSGKVIDLWAVSGATITAGAGTGLKITLQNGGSVGTATAALGTVGSGTADDRWVADTVVGGSVLSGASFNAGDVLVVDYDETGTVNTAVLNVGFHVRYGK
jgi:hypothetical protein